MATISRLILFVLALSFVSLGRAEARPVDNEPATRHLMPVPSDVRFGSGKLALTKAFAVAVKGFTDARLQAAIDRAVRRLERRTGIELARGLAADPVAATLVVECQGAAKPVPELGEDESYTLEVSGAQAVLRAPTVLGVLRGLETLLQLVESGRDGYYLPEVSIKDAPRFPWRGLLIDVSRHFEPVEVLERNLDGMAAVKLNVLHWHLTDDQGFRVESRKYPKLHTMGSDGLFYTQEQIREVIAYAADRGIRVVPEFDLPGHATSWLVGHPELGSAPGPYTIERQAGIFEPVLDPTREDVYKVLDGFFGEMAALFPDAYMHIGGDENEGHQWDRNPEIQAFMKANDIADNHALQAYFNQRLLKILTRHGKRMMGWDEILHPDLPKNVVVQSWRGPESLAAAARQGYNGILSSGYYLDLMYPASRHYLVDPIPAGSTLTPEETARVLGGEAAMWSEYVSPDTIDSRIWPRAAAVAERLWSPRTVTDVGDMYRRLDDVSVQLEELGLTHEKNVAMLLRNMARDDGIAPLQTLVSVVEPVKDYNRGQMHPTTMLSPLTSLVDAARADSAEARHFSAMVDELLGDAPRFHMYEDRIEETLTRWRDVRPALDVTIDGAPVLREAEPLAGNLSDVGLAGLEAISYLSAGMAPAPGWLEAKMAMLDEAAKPKAAVELAVVPSVKRLVVAAAELPRLKTMTVSEWREHVKTIADRAKTAGGNQTSTTAAPADEHR